MGAPDRFVIAQLSDIHCGDCRFDPKLGESCLREVEAAQPDVALVPGDLTASGYPEEYEEALAFLERLPCPWFVVPGNHDERNVGWRIYERLFGPRWHRRDVDFGVATERRQCQTMRVVACDSSEPDLNEGELGRVRHTWIAENFEGAEDAFRVVMMHHHLIAVPNTGRERNTLNDAGDVLAVLGEQGVDLVLSGHKHVPHLWNVSGMAILTSGTATTWRIRGEVPPSLNIIEITPESMNVRVAWTSGEEHLRLSVPRRT